MDKTIRGFLDYAANIKPTARQLAWYDTGFYAFVHFSPNTYTGLEWGHGDEDPAIFNPTGLDCDSWVEAVKAAGMKGLILTAKHHDGFCLWQTKTTMHSMKSSLYKNGKGDVVKEAADACRRGGIKFGFYLSPWDRNCPVYGTPAYNDFYKTQLTELLTGYGDIFEVWFDGACGEGPNGKNQEYDFEGYIKLIRKYQPNAVIFNDRGPDVRYCGNEAGKGRAAEWAVVPYELCDREQEAPIGDSAIPGTMGYIRNEIQNIGGLDAILYSRKLVFAGAEIDTSIRRGWFYHSYEEPHSLEKLFDIYLASVGSNACLNLNIPPMPSGRFDPRDIARLKELGDLIKTEFGNDITGKAEIAYTCLNEEKTQLRIDISFQEKVRPKYFVLSEDISKGQRVSSFIIADLCWDGKYRNFYDGTCIGNKKICAFDDGRCANCTQPKDKFRITITAARGEIFLKNLIIYA